MMPAKRFKPYAPDVHAVVRLEEALPPDHPVHVFVDLVRSIDLAHFLVPPGPKGEKPYHPHALFGVLAGATCTGSARRGSWPDWRGRRRHSSTSRAVASRITARWHASGAKTRRRSSRCSRRR